MANFRMFFSSVFLKYDLPQKCVFEGKSRKGSDAAKEPGKLQFGMTHFYELDGERPRLQTQKTVKVRLVFPDWATNGRHTVDGWKKSSTTTWDV